MKISRWIAASAVLLTFSLAQAQAPLPVPRRASEFAINMVGSKPILLSQYKGKPVILAFILTECPHCQDAVKILSKLQTEFAAQGLQVLAAAIDQDADKRVAPFNQKFRPTFPVGYTTSGLMTVLTGPLGQNTEMPILAFIDRTGTIVFQATGDQPFFKTDEEGNIRKQIAILLKAPAAPAVKKAAPKSTKK